MEVNSAFGAGTTVILELPLRQKSEQPSRLDLEREQVQA
jgi:hypothetical protein